MPIIRKAASPDENKMVITEKELKKEIANAILHGIQPEDVRKLVTGAQETDNKFELEGKLLPIIQRNLDRIVELVTDSLMLMTVKGGKKYNLYYQSPSDGREIPFTVDYARDLKCGDEKVEEQSWREIFEKSKTFLKEALGESDLAKAFLRTFLDYATAPGSDILSKYAPEVKEEKESEMDEWEREQEEKKKEEELKKRIFEREPTEEELMAIEEGEDLESEYEYIVGEDFLEEDTLETDFDEFLSEDEYFGELPDEEEEGEESEEDEDDNKKRV
jgi:hypothetical protein